jgi:cation transport regulator ChaB
MNTTLKYSSNAELPGSIREELSEAAQSAYRQAYNDAWAIYSRDIQQDENGTAAETRAQFAHEAGLKAAKTA